MPYAVTIKESPGNPGKVYHPLHLKDVPMPRPSEHQVLIRLEAAALNHRDIFIRRSLYPGVAFDVPLFADGCGVVEGAGTEELAQKWRGKRVVLTPGQGWEISSLGPERSYTVRGGTRNAPEGTLQEWIAVDEREIEEAPGHLTAIEAASLPLTGLTAWRALMTKGENAATGSNILITGAGGGVALMALLYAVHMGINVYVNAASPERISQAMAMGAKGGVLFQDSEWPAKLKAMLPEERNYLDSVIDGAGADIVAKTMKLLKHGGTIVSYGMTTGPSVAVPMGAVMRNLQFHGTTTGSRREFAEMLSYIKEKKIFPIISNVVRGITNLNALDELFATMRKGEQFGKLVVEIDETGQSKKSKM
ncbi:unnamed protein product [Penicillium salamii]|uniref:Enoyl reductase (ER) domain-containing protein n=1 Tax=Penicillium salamii TaxID=1612424 RepID=A0A9W4JM85_9EURO|nr:unnamed protein product [Penicillium salamii]CAG8105032.1 unnamed protein product [Penicillium salamii]CAG8139136.1 unnamed protein product [Penicillium salamii]CAG8143295.1 unnamed protein product [Penicillium salamii]CAG8178463.1 unnamed protein product [Penicillium salamii]